MSPNRLPAIYTPPAPTDGIGLAAEVLAIAQASPEHAATLTRVVCLLLGGAGAPAAVAAPAPSRAKLKGSKRGKRSGARTPDPKRLPAPPAKSAAPKADFAVCLEKNEEAITFNGKTMEVTAPQAHLASLLAAAWGSPVGRDFLIKKLFPKRQGTSADVGLGQLAGKLKDAVAGIGLDVASVRGVGIMLRPLE